jgi:hypothetical protein
MGEQIFSMTWAPGYCSDGYGQVKSAEHNETLLSLHSPGYEGLHMISCGTEQLSLGFFQAGENR